MEATEGSQLNDTDSDSEQENKQEDEYSAVSIVFTIIGFFLMVGGYACWLSVK